MPFLDLMPELIRRRSGRVELTISRWTRLLYATLGLVLVLVLARESAGRPFAIMFSIVIALATLSEDRWVFDGQAGEVRKRYGTLVFAKSWAIDLDMVSSIELEADFRGADQTDPYAKVARSNPGKGSAIRLVLNDGRTMVICVAASKRLGDLRVRAAALAEVVGRPLVEA